MTSIKLANSYSSTVAFSITTLAKWILCAPYLSGSLSNAVLGWILLFNARERVNVRVYMLIFSSYDSQILYMDQILLGRVFGCKDRHELLLKLDYLAARCIIINLEGTRTEYLKAKLTLNALPDIYATARAGISRE